MNIEDFRNYCLTFNNVSEELPFDNSTLVFKVKGKIFTLSKIDDFSFINVKCNPEYALELRELFSEVYPTYHMNKKHWNSINIKGNLSDKQIKKWINDSYNLVLMKIPKRQLYIKLTDTPI